jgi:DNA-binding transcriptional LysR family regulator
VSIKTPRLIRDRCGAYYFRLIVPLILRQSVGKMEFRRSLRTNDSANLLHRPVEFKPNTRHSMEDGFGRHLADINIVVEIKSTETIKQAVIAGMGISFLSAHTVSQNYSRGA